MGQLRKMMCGDQCLIMKCIQYNEPKIVEVIKEGILDCWDTSVEFRIKTLTGS